MQLEAETGRFVEALFAQREQSAPGVGAELRRIRVSDKIAVDSARQAPGFVRLEINEDDSPV